jgi:hypothetical protein
MNLQKEFLTFEPLHTLIPQSIRRQQMALRQIEYYRGNIRTLDREGLEDVACECYSVLRELM